MSQLYCVECQNYLMGSDGECHDCSCGWRQPVETYASENSSLENERDELKEKIEALQAENVELKAEDEISAAVIEKCCNLLAQIAITLKGEPEELTRHGYHDLPELVSVLHVENELNKNQILGQSDEIESLRKQCNNQAEIHALRMKMLEHQNKSLLDQLVKADLLAPRTYVIELPAGATTIASKNGE